MKQDGGRVVPTAPGKHWLWEMDWSRRLVAMETTFTCQRWPVGAELVHAKSGKRVRVLEFEMQGFWASQTGRHPETGEWIDRYVVFPTYRVYVIGDEWEHGHYADESDLKMV